MECDLSGGTITWRGVTFRNVSGTQEECKAKFTAATASLLSLHGQLQGAADLTIRRGEFTDDEDTFDCQMPGRGWPMPPKKTP